MDMDISVVICTYDGAKRLPGVLESLQGLVSPRQNWELIVVDNNSTDVTERVIEAFKRRGTLPLRYVFEPSQGHCYARNAGIRAAEGGIVAFTDDDVTVDSEWLAQVEQAFDASDCVAVGGKIIATWNCPRPRWLAVADRYRLMEVIVRFDMGEEKRPLTIPPFGANMAFRKAVFEKYGLFRTDLGRKGKSLVGFDDTEFCRRLLRAGEAIMYVPKAVVYHPVERKRLRKSYFLAWYFDYGRGSVLLNDSPADAVAYLGVPRSTLRESGFRLLKWLLSVGPHRRFYYKLEFWRSAGEIAEFYRRARLTNGRVRA
jgi:glycosyltransferase involved in cell wall biosynthesis